MNYDLIEHVKGGSIYIDDKPLPKGTLHAAVITSPSAKGLITKANYSEVLSSTGVYSVITADDIPGDNQIGTIIKDEPLLSGGEVDYIGMPVALVLADTKLNALLAVRKALFEITEHKPVVDPRTAYKKGEIIGPERTFSMGNPKEIWSTCAYVIEGSAESGAQEHFYLETQAAVAVPGEGKRLLVYSSTQAPATVQKVIASVLDLGMNDIEVDVRRLGGAFGGKEDQATAWAVLAALGAKISGKAVKLVLPRSQDMVITGKRHPYSSDYKIGFSKEGKILAYTVMFYQNTGAAADLSTAVLERTLFHAAACYYIPDITAKAACCRTNLPPFTAFRGFGGPQGMFVIESALFKAADIIGIPYFELQKINLLKEGDIFPYGQKVLNCRAEKCLTLAEKTYDFKTSFKEAEQFNSLNSIRKKGFSVMPICFGISFTNTSLNQGFALLNIYQDGTVGVSAGAVEMGQGVNRKIQLIVAGVFQIPPELIKIEASNTTRTANSSATAASCGADLNGKAAEIAALSILTRIQNFMKEKNFRSYSNDGQFNPEIWKKIISAAYWGQSTLSAFAHYVTPDIYFDKSTEKGDPFAYHAYGIAGIQTSLDCLTGEYTIDKVQIVHDLGNSIDTAVDIGQIEGGLVQGIGWVTVEEFLFNENGRILTNNCGNYKVPDTKGSVDIIEIEFLKDAENPNAVFGSKAVGEPPFLYGIAAYFSILSAMKAYKKESILFNAPLTPEKVFFNLFLSDNGKNKR